MDYKIMIAGFINAVAVVGVVQFLKVYLPIINEKVSWLLPVLAAAIGPAVAVLQNVLFTWLGIPIDLSPIAAVFTGATAVAIYQVKKQATA